MGQKTKQKCVYHNDRDALFKKLCRECCEEHAANGNREYIDFFAALKDLDKAQKKRKKKEEVLGSDFFEGIATMLQEKNDFWFSGVDEFYIWNKDTGLWTNDAQVVVNNVIAKFRQLCMTANPDTMKKMMLTTMIRESTAILKARLAYSAQTMPVPDNNLIPLNNGIYDMDTKTLIPYTADHFFTTKIPWNYNPDAAMDRFPALMNDWYGDKIITGWEIMALSLFRGYPIHKFFILYSAGGQGKTTFFNILIDFLGENNTCAVPLTKLNDPFSAIGLRHKYANVADEAPPEKITNTEMLKQVTGESNVEARYPFRAFVRFYNYATMVFSLNPQDHFPGTNDTSDGFFRRLCMIEFKGSLATISPIKNLAKSITRDTEEMEGILYYTIGVLHDLRDNDWKMRHEESIADTKQRLLEASDPLQLFINLFCNTEEGLIISKNDFKDHLNAYLKHVGKKGYDYRSVNKSMQEKSYPETKKSGEYWDKQIPAWKNIDVDCIKLHEYLQKAAKESLESVGRVQRWKIKISAYMAGGGRPDAELISSLIDCPDIELISDLISEIQ